MNRIDFMNRLSLLLSDIPENEREEAIQYYNDYLNDAGVENEEEVLEALGAPEDLAASIRKGLLEGSGQEGEFSEKGYRESDGGSANEVACRQGGEKESHKDWSGGSRFASDKKADPQAQGTFSGRKTERDAHRAEHTGRAESANLDRRYRRGRKENRSSGMTALIVLLCILLAPVAVPVIFTVALVVLILAAVLIFLVVIFLFVGIICIVAGVVSLFGSVVDLFTFPAGAIMAFGMSLMTIGFGVLLTLGIGWVLAKLFPKAFRSAVDFCSGLFRKKGGNEA